MAKFDRSDRALSTLLATGMLFVLSAIVTAVVICSVGQASDKDWFKILVLHLIPSCIIGVISSYIFFRSTQTPYGWWKHFVIMAVFFCLCIAERNNNYRDFLKSIAIIFLSQMFAAIICLWMKASRNDLMQYKHLDRDLNSIDDAANLYSPPNGTVTSVSGQSEKS